MKKALCLMLLVFSFFITAASAQAPDKAPPKNINTHLQDISVTIRAGRSEGSGIIILRNVQGRNVNFIWTAAHVIDSAKQSRIVIKNGVRRQIVSFDDVQVIKELVESGRRVGEIKMEASVIAYSDADYGHDLALLVVRKTNFINANAEFYLHDGIPPIGTSLFHVGSLRGQFGANSMTDGILSQVGRVMDGTVYDQTTVTAFPGSSGGGVFLASGLKKGKCVGMVVRGAGESFNLIVPVRRMRRFAAENNLLFAIDGNAKVPPLTEILKLRMGVGIPTYSTKKKDNMTYYLIRKVEDQPALGTAK